MRARPLLLAALTACAVSSPGASTAAPSSHVAPYTSASAFSECGGDMVSDLTGGPPASLASCQTSADADETAGTLSMALAIESPAEGMAPAARNARGSSEIVLEAGNDAVLREIPVSVRIQVATARVERVGQLQPGGEDLSETFLSFGFSIRHSSCRCNADQAIVIASPAGGVGSITDQLVTLSTTFRAPPGETFAAGGHFIVETGAGGFISLGRANLTADTGRITARAELEILDVTLG